MLYENVHTEVVGKRTKTISLLSDFSSDSIESVLKLYDAQYGNFKGQNEEKFKKILKEYIEKNSGYNYKECREK